MGIHVNAIALENSPGSSAGSSSLIVSVLMLSFVISSAIINVKKVVETIISNLK